MSYVFDVIRVPFGWLINKFYSWTGIYLLAIILFAIVLKIVLFPFGIKQQRTSQKQAKLRPKENVIRKKYAGRTDRATQMKMNEEIQQLYKEENVSPFSGCLPMLIQMIILLAVYAVVRSPLTYTATLPADKAKDQNAVYTINTAISYMVYEKDEAAFAESKNASFDQEVKQFVRSALDYKDTTKAARFAALTEQLHAGSYNLYSEINAIQYLKNEDNRAEFIEYLAKNESFYHYTAEEAKELMEALPELELFKDFSLGTDPDISFITDSSLPAGKRLTLIVPVLTLITAYLGQMITRKFTYQPPQAQQQAGQMKMMNIFMPLFSLYISFVVPLAVSIYWIIQNVLNPVQQIILSKLFPIPEITPEEMREAERAYGGKTKKKKDNSAVSKRRSLVYDDDDDDDTAPSPSEENGSLTEKTDSEINGEETKVDKAPLKDD